MPSPRRLVRKSIRMLERAGLSRSEAASTVVDVVSRAAARMPDDLSQAGGWLDRLAIAALAEGRDHCPSQSDPQEVSSGHSEARPDGQPGQGRQRARRH